MLMADYQIEMMVRVTVCVLLFFYIEDNGISKAHFLQACPDCLVMHFSNTITVAGVPIRMVRSFYIFGRCVCVLLSRWLCR